MAKPYHILIAPAAKRQLQTLPAKHQKLIIKLAEAIGINPRPPGCKKIEGMTGLYRQTINNHHLIYKVEDQEILVLLIK